MGSNLQLNKDIEEYINNKSLKLNAIQSEIINYNNTLGEIKKMQISISQCHFLTLIIKILKPKEILEIGTFTGLSTLTMGLSLSKNAKILAIDKNKKTSEKANSFFKKANIKKKINLIVDNANKVLDKLILNNKKFDLAFIDADKENYINYFEKSLKIVNKNGFIIVDNVLWYGDVVDKSKNDRLTLKIREFNDFAMNNSKVETVIMPLGDGLSINRVI